jgi:hypothetical protein
VAVGHVFYKDGSNLVATYNTTTVDMLLLSATTVRQAGFSFVSMIDYDILRAPEHAAQRAAQRAGFRANHPNAAFTSVQQNWDFQHPCSHCGCIFLVSENPLFRVKCCRTGTLLVSTSFPHLYSLPPQLEHLAVTKVNHMTNSSSYYNGALQLGNL